MSCWPAPTAHDEEADMLSARIDGVDLAYEVAGTGPRVLFLNGSGGTLERSRLLIDVVGRGVELLAYDQRGLGASGPAPGPYDMARCAADALGLLDAVGWDGATVLGVSFGGMVAQELAVTAPGRVERLVLLCTSPGGAGRSSYPLHELEDLSPEKRAELRRTLLDDRFDEAWLDEHPGDRTLLELLTQVDADEGPEETAGRRAQMAARRGHDVWDRLGAINCPTFVGAGRYDPIAPTANSEAIASRVPGAELHVYEGGHAFFVQDPAALPEIRAFLHGTGR
jgi:pimeloyl-ACP methyl ester carboxylesterase